MTLPVLDQPTTTQPWPAAAPPLPVALPPLPAMAPAYEPDHDDARYWLTAKGAVAVAGTYRVSFMPMDDELVAWDPIAERWDRLAS